MVALNENSVFESEIYRIEIDDPVVGGEPNPTTGGGLDNIPHLQLANRTLWLREMLLARYTNGQIDAAIAAAMAVLTANEILTRVKTVDGSGSGLDADLLDGLHAAAFWKYADAPALISAGGGYQVFPSGLIMQWGIGSAPSFNYPIAFPSSVFVVMVQDTAASTPNAFSVASTSLTAATVQAEIAGDSLSFFCLGR